MPQLDTAEILLRHEKEVSATSARLSYLSQVVEEQTHMTQKGFDGINEKLDKLIEGGARQEERVASLEESRRNGKTFFWSIMGVVFAAVLGYLGLKP